jgi:hypothetical protein
MGETKNQVFENREVTLKQTRSGALPLRDVRNEGTTGDVYENTREWTKCTLKKRPFYRKMH